MGWQIGWDTRREWTKSCKILERWLLESLKSTLKSPQAMKYLQEMRMLSIDEHMSCTDWTGELGGR